MKPMLSTKELIEHMKEKGITFRETSEKEAMDFLENNNYYMKLAAIVGVYKFQEKVIKNLLTNT